jgi:uncharacterized membrane protein
MKRWDFEDIRTVARGFLLAFVGLLFVILMVGLLVFVIHLQPCPKLLKIWGCIIISMLLILAIAFLISEIVDGISHMKWYFRGSDKCPKWLKWKDND